MMSTGSPSTNARSSSTISSSPDRKFLHKVNAADCPNGNGVPEDNMDWENQDFQSNRPRKIRGGISLPHVEIRDPDPGDHLMIWINERDGGAGLTATARISSVVEEESQLRIRVPA